MVYQLRLDQGQKNRALRREKLRAGEVIAMKKTIAKIILVALAIFMLASNVRAQMEIRDQVKQLLTRNEELLQKAKSLVIETSSAKARASLLTSVSLQGEAMKLFRHAEDNYLNGHTMIALQQMMKARDIGFNAREAIMRTIALAKREAMTEENALKAMDQARKRLEIAGDLLAESRGAGIFSARKLIEDAKIQLDRSRDNLREHMYDVAFRLARLSESLATKAINILKRETRAVDEVAMELEKTDRILERIKEYDNHSMIPPAEKSFEEALNLQAKARGSFEGKHFKAALDLTRKARRIAFRTLSIISKDTRGENLERAIKFTDQLIEKAYEIIKQNNLIRLEERLDNAAKLQQKAKREIEKGRVRNALRLTNKARTIVKQTLESLDIPLKLQEVKKALESTDKLIERVKQNIEIQDNKTARNLLEKALKHQRRAWEGFTNNKLKFALTHTKLARNLTREAMAILGNEGI